MELRISCGKDDAVRNSSAADVSAVEAMVSSCGLSR